MFGELKDNNKKNNSESVNSDFSKVVMKAIGALTIVALLLPIVTMIGLFSSVNLALFQNFGFDTKPDPIKNQLKLANRNNGINSGENTEYLKAIFTKIDENTSTIEEARLATNLNIIFADFNQNVAPINTNTTFFQSPDENQKILLRVNQATRLLGLDMKNIGNSASVVISNRPIIFNIANQPKNLVARLGVENKLPFDIVNFNGPILAGFRVQAFNFYKAIDPSELTSTIKERRRNSKLCSAIKDWQVFFDVEVENIRIWHAINPLSLMLHEKSIKSSYVKPVRYKDYQKLCMQNKW